jgi:hypothetical protein
MSRAKTALPEYVVAITSFSCASSDDDTGVTYVREGQRERGDSAVAQASPTMWVDGTGDDADIRARAHQRRTELWPA